jgi:hypothetical protein
MSNYRAPGPYVTDVYQPLVNPNVLGSKLHAVAVNIPSLTADLYPVTTLAVKRSASGMVDTLVIAIPNPSLGQVLDATNRVASVTQYNVTYIHDTDYTVTSVGPLDAGGIAGQVTVTLTWISTKYPTASTSYSAQIRYEFPQTPAIYFSYSDYQATFGSTLADASGTLSDIATIGYLMFQENAPQVMIAPYDSNGTYGLTAALTALANTSPMTTVSVLSNDLLYSGGPNTAGSNYALLQHVMQTSTVTAKKYRIGLCGINNSGATDYTGQVAVANSNRILIIGPDTGTVNLPIGVNNTDVLTPVNTGYLAAIYGAIWSRSTTGISDSMTRKVSNTLVSVSPAVSDITQDFVASQGVTLFTNTNGSVVVRDDITTTPSMIFQAEPNITLISDDITRDTLSVLDGNVIGALLDDSTITLVQALISTMLKGKVTDRVIQKFGTVSVTQSTLDPRSLIVTVPIVPMFATKYIDITFSYQLAI